MIFYAYVSLRFMELLKHSHQIMKIKICIYIQYIVIRIYILDVYPYLSSLNDAQATEKAFAPNSELYCVHPLYYIHAMSIRICRVLLYNFAHYC